MWVVDLTASAQQTLFHEIQPFLAINCHEVDANENETVFTVFNVIFFSFTVRDGRGFTLKRIIAWRVGILFVFVARKKKNKARGLDMLSIRLAIGCRPITCVKQDNVATDHVPVG